MNMPFELHVALRYLLAKRKQAFISVISLISTLGVTVGVMALVIALALMTGLQEELRDRILGANPHVYVWKTQRHRRLPRRGRQAARRCRASSARRRRFSGKALISAGRGDAAASRSRASIPGSSRRSPTSSGAMQSGSLEALDAPTKADEPDGILLGKDLAAQARRRRRRHGVAADAAGDAVADGHDAAARARLRVAGIFSLGLYEFDSTYGFVSLDVAKRLLGKDEVDLIQLRVDDIYAAPADRRGRSRRRSGSDYVAAGLGRHEPVAVLGALAREDGDLDRRSA